ncbi:MULTISPECIES: MFS transporter [unclassified Microcoleus]|uniref:MFS transporter n=2 Tax=unclassified Microcoleus TaxID=2642155 RepID=UPI001D6B6EC2|nr:MULTISPECIES: MFS transporter [unclassified Microcoleus]MCC3504586.1 MFS transporter [Microcoleus sp. PH2017_19_SFW_U_A]MCC3567787.1 MFS transporter [Microcoleus sp. PH2017_31_RDM_U_A]MCC3575012.1 MFS transporter [Microcoleus sp. PH2017_34_RAT_O_A]MCC3599422.1 MFS transporter [Microcoleus sp. PH2017_26_ELK_O_A]MCC3523778.1 MFS transporter [Microcoleus sp. PH2017_20_SFW_D_A]
MSATAPKPASMWSPLAQPVFRALWLASGVSSIGTWMHDVGASWLMTSLSPSPLLIAMMQAASSLPFFMLALPAGAIADVVDRRRLLLFTQGWMLAAAALLGILTVANLTTPWILLTLTFVMSIGSAVNMPVWQAITPELVAKEQLPSAVTLTGIVINLSRSVGPALAGIIIASAGTGFVFLLNAASFIGVILVIYTWQRKPQETALPAERFIGAMQAGIRYVRYSPPFQAVLIRAGAYIFFASALFAMLPLLGRRELGLDAFRYGIILGFWGIGGLAGAFILPKIRQRISTDLSVAAASAVFGTMMLVLSYARNFYAVCAAMLVVGLSSLTVMVSLNVAAQTAVPTWVRARALATYLLVFQGSMTFGSLLWGIIAQQAGISVSLNMAGVGAIATTALATRYRLRCAEKMDLTSSLHWQQPAHSFEPSPNDGPVLITLEYCIDPADANSFKQVMQALSRTRRRDGAIQWGLYQDLSHPSRFVETIIVESWAEHKRQFERVTNADRAIEETARAFHIGDTPPKVSQMIYGNPDNR